MSYRVKRCTAAPTWDFNWDSWNCAQTVTLENVRPESSDHKPAVSCRVLHDSTNIYGLYKVEDKYVRAVHTEFQSSVCQDSCVEFFFKPSTCPGYFNLEMNAGGTFLIYYVSDPTRTSDGLEKYTEVAPEHGKLITVKTTLPKVIEPEITEPVTWYAQFAIPAAALEPYCGKLPAFDGQEWTCNFYKCGDKTSHPHWLSWMPVPILNFHLPEVFAPMILE